MNELDIKSNEYYNIVECFNNIPHYCIRPEKQVKFRKNVLLIINCDSDLFLHHTIRSLYNKTNKDDFTLVIFDNSNSTRFNIDIYSNYGFDNIFYINNTKWYNGENDDVGRRAIIDIESVYTDKSASIMHCRTVDFMMKILKYKGVENLLLADSDVLFKKNPFEIVDEKYACIGEYENEKHRIAPYLLYLNLNKINIDFYDETRMLGITSTDYRKYDTCGSFTEDLFKSDLPYKEINIKEYIEHFGAGSYAYNTDSGFVRDIYTKNNPLKTYDLIWDWLKEHGDLYK